MKPVALGVIGCGVIGKVHLQSASQTPAARTVAVADLRVEAAKEAAERFGVKTVYASGEELLEDNQVEAVILAMPTGARRGLAVKALKKGKHVLVEKPIAMNSREVRQMIAARGKLVAGCCSSRNRFLPSGEALAKAIASGVLGDIRVVRARSIGPAGEKPETPRPAWRLIRALNGGGILVNWGCYDLDYLLGSCGWTLKPEVVLAQTWTIPPVFESHVAPGSDAETHYAAIVRCEGGAILSIERGEYCAAAHDEAWGIIGTKASLRFQMTPGANKKIILDEGTTDKGVASKTIWEGSEDWSIVHNALVHDFALAIRENRQPKTSLEQALVIQQITDAIYASARRGTAVRVR